jgi:hypothetical protein
VFVIVSQGPDSNIQAKLQGLSVKAQTRLLEDSKAQPGAAGACSSGQQPHQHSSAEQGSQAGVPQQQQQVATSILEPCDVRVTMKSTEAVQDISVDVSALQLRMSPDVLQLLLHLQQVCAIGTAAMILCVTCCWQAMNWGCVPSVTCLHDVDQHLHAFHGTQHEGCSMQRFPVDNASC